MHITHVDIVKELATVQTKSSADILILYDLATEIGNSYWFFLSVVGNTQLLVALNYRGQI